MTIEKEPIVKFSLWYVLGAIICAGAIVASYLSAGQTEVRTKQQEVIQRVTKLEAQYCSIQENLHRLVVANERLLDKLDSHLMKKIERMNGEQRK